MALDPPPRSVVDGGVYFNITSPDLWNMYCTDFANAGFLPALKLPFSNALLHASSCRQADTNNNA
jgi:hypothetical protein